MSHQNFTPPRHPPRFSSREQLYGTPNLPLGEAAGGGKTGEPGVLLLTDDPHVQRDVTDALGSGGYPLRVMADPREIWEMEVLEAPACLLCSHPMRNGVSGFDVLAGIRLRELPLPTLFVAEDRNVELVVRAMQCGADDFLTLPLDSGRLCGALDHSFQRASQRWDHARAVAVAKARVATLDKREREVIRLTLNGFINKETADYLGLALVTVKVYRARAMKKLGAGNAPEMVRVVGLGGMCDEEPIPRPG